MASTLAELRSDLQLIVRDTNFSDANLNNFINKGMRKVARTLKPREFKENDTFNIVQATNTVVIPTDMYRPIIFRYKKSASGDYRTLRQVDYKNLYGLVGAERMNDSSRQGVPSRYAIDGANFIFDYYFPTTGTDRLLLDYLKRPAVLTLDADTSELPEDYDQLVVYEAAVKFFEYDDDEANINRYRILAKDETNELRASFNYNDESQIELDERTWSYASNGNWLSSVIDYSAG